MTAAVRMKFVDLRIMSECMGFSFCRAIGLEGRRASVLGGSLPVSSDCRLRAPARRPRDSRRDAGATLLGYGLALPSDVVASMPPRPMVSTAEEGTMTIAPFSLMAS